MIRARRGAGKHSRGARVSGAARATRRCAQNGRARGRARATTHPAVGLAVHFVAEDHEREVLGVARARLAEELFPPGVETLERLSSASAESSSVGVAAAADGPRRGAATRHVWTPRRAAAAIKNDAARRGAQGDRGQGRGGATARRVMQRARGRPGGGASRRMTALPTNNSARRGAWALRGCGRGARAPSDW